MEKLKFAKFRCLFTALLMSVLFVAGIPGIVLSAGKNVPVMVISIVCVVLGFYVMPLVWIKYGGLCSMHRVLRAIERENLYTVKEISSHLKLGDKRTVELIDKMIFKEYLTGYQFIANERLVLNENKKLAPSIDTLTCRYCGAKFTVQGKEGACPYCGSVNKSE